MEQWSQLLALLGGLWRYLVPAQLPMLLLATWLIHTAEREMVLPPRPRNGLCGSLHTVSELQGKRCPQVALEVMFYTAGRTGHAGAAGH